MVQDFLGSLPWSFKLVELAPLLAYQHHVATDHSSRLCAKINTPPTLDQMVDICLLSTLQPIVPKRRFEQSGMWLESNDLNFRMRGADLYFFGQPQPGHSAPLRYVAGLMLGPGLPLVQVARFNGRCYLRNGFHRAYGLGRAKASHIPCVLIDAQSWDQVGAVGAPATFDQVLLESQAPPTCGHFISGRATDVKLRTTTRIIHLSWSEYVYADDV